VKQASQISSQSSAISRASLLYPGWNGVLVLAVKGGMEGLWIQDIQTGLGGNTEKQTVS